MVEWIKTHKVSAAIIAIVGGLVFLMLVRGGGGATTASNASTASSDALQAHMQDNQTAVSIASLNAKNNLDIATLAAGIEGAKVAASQTVDLASIAAHTTDSQYALQAIQAQLDVQSQAQKQAYFATINQQQENTAISLSQIGAQREATAYDYSLQEQQMSANLGLQNKQLDIINGLVSKQAA